MDYASSELRLIKHQAIPGSLQNNQFLSLCIAAKTDGFLIPTIRDTVLLCLTGTQSVISATVFVSPLLTLRTAVKYDSVLLPGELHGSVRLYLVISPAVESYVNHIAAVLVTAIVSGKHIGNTLPSTPKLLNIQKAEIVSDTSPLEKTFLAVSCGLISPGFVYRNMGNCKELNLFTHTVSQTALPQGQAEYNLKKGALTHVSLPGEELPGQEQILSSSRRPSSSVTHTSLEIIRAMKEGQMPLSGESKVDEKLTLEIGKSGVFDEQIILTISRAREFMERELLRSQRGESLVETHQRLELMKAVIAKVFIETGARVGKELSPERCQTGQSALNIQPQLRLGTAAISGTFEGVERTEKLRQFGLSSSIVTESQDIANMLFKLNTATVVGTNIGQNLPAVPLELSLLKSPVRDSSIVYRMDSLFPLFRGSLSGALVGSGNQHGLSELFYNTMMWIGSSRFDEKVFLWGANSNVTFDLKIQLMPCGSFDELIVVERIGYATADEAVSLGKAISYDSIVDLAPCRSLDELISLRRAGSGLVDEQVDFLRNYMESVKVDEMIVVIAKAMCDEFIALRATPTIIGFDESLLTERSSIAKVDESIYLTMTYYL